MRATIQVEKKKEGEFLVTVAEGGTRSSHRVTVRQDHYVGLIRFRGHVPKGGYDVQNGINEGRETGATTVQ
jgi:hypothetical protein